MPPFRSAFSKLAEDALTFATSQYNGGPQAGGNPFQQASDIPAWHQPRLGKYSGDQPKKAEMQKEALVGELAAALRADVPGTKRWFLSRKSPEQLKHLADRWNAPLSRVKKPLHDVVDKVVSKIPGKTPKKVVGYLTRGAINSPEGAVLPFPGGTVVADAAKKVIERGLNRFSGIDKVVHASVTRACLGHLLKEAAGAPTRGGFMMASDIPPWQQPDLGQSPTKAKFSGESPPQESPSLPANDRYAGDGTSADSNEFHPPKVGEVKKKPAKEKDSDGDSAGFCTWSPGDFHSVNPNAKSAPKIGSALDMSTEKMAEFVAELLKESAALPRAADLLRSGAPKMPHIGLKPPTAIPKSVPGLSKPPALPPPMPQPIQLGHPTLGIAKQVKPVGPQTGNAIPGAASTTAPTAGSLGGNKPVNRFTMGKLQT